MSWKRTLLLGLVFGVSGLAYAAWAGKRERDSETRRRLAELGEEELDVETWCTCSGDHECEGHRC